MSSYCAIIYSCGGEAWSCRATTGDVAKRRQEPARRDVRYLRVRLLQKSCTPTTPVGCKIFLADPSKRDYYGQWMHPESPLFDC